jgi:hypothetical protein
MRGDDATPDILAEGRDKGKRRAKGLMNPNETRRRPITAEDQPRPALVVNGSKPM